MTHQHIRIGRSPFLVATRPVALMGVPFGLGAGKPGCELAPGLLRHIGLPQMLREGGAHLTDHGDLRPAGGMPDASPRGRLGHHAAEVASVIASVKHACHAAFAEGALPVVMGGDHSISMGSVAAAQEAALSRGRRLKLLWVDAHADFNTPATSPSGNLHGMSLAHACGEAALAALGSMPARPVLAADILVFGARDIDPGERRRLDRHGVKTLGCDALAELRSWLAAIDPARDHLHVSLDADALDPAVTPGVGTPVAGGLSMAQAEAALLAAHETGAIGSFDLVEVNPSLDSSGRTAGIMAGLATLAITGSNAGAWRAVA